MDVSTLVCPVCPHCGAERIAFQLLSQVDEPSDTGKASRYYQLWKCGNCGLPACSYSCHAMRFGGNSLDSLLGFFPILKEIKAPYGVPEDIANTFRSALRYLKLGRDADYEAACIMARRGIEMAVGDFGGAGQNLFQKINDLEAKRLIPPAMRDWAHHLREIGNAGAHGERISREDAQQAVYFAEMLFTYLYSLPRRMEEYQRQAG